MVQTTEKTNFQANHSAMTDAPFVEVSKEFNAPIELVWQAWSDPEMIKQWYGPVGYTCPSAEIDFRIDGKALLAMKSPEGKVIWGTGVYKEIFPLQLIVCTDDFADENGNIISAVEAGMGEAWRGVGTLIYSVKFDKIEDTHTKIQLVHEGIPASEHDDCVQGWSSSFEKLKELVEKR